MAKSSRPEGDSPSAPQRQGVPPVIRHDFGFRVTVPAAWEVEYTPKVTMDGGHVVYITPRGNIFFVFFGKLEEMKVRYKTIDEYAKTAPRRLPTQGELTGKYEYSSEVTVSGHRAIVSSIQGTTKAGAFADVWILDVWCEESKRYYSIYGEFTQRGEFPYFPRIFSFITESLVCHGADADRPRSGWLWADIGYSIRASLWFIQLFDFTGLLEFYQAREIMLKSGTGVQYQWPQQGSKPMWHVRERIVAQDVKRVHYDEKGVLIVEEAPVAPTRDEVPTEYAAITYAYSLYDSRGFVEFRDAKDDVIKKIEGKWIAVENLTHRTVGTFPKIRLRAERDDIESIVVTPTSVVIRGKSAQ